MPTHATHNTSNPIVIIGGFASNVQQYEHLRDILAIISGRPVMIAPINLIDWIGVMASDSYGSLLRILALAVSAARAEHGGRHVTLVAHSAGGVLARIYLGDQPYGPRRICYDGYQHVDTLITLGTPHNAVGVGRQGGLNQIAYAQRFYPGAYWPTLRYVSVIGKSIFGAPDGSPIERGAWQSYRILGAEGTEWGDGVVPLANGLLDGSRKLVISGLRHDNRPDRPWYGTDATIVRAWWDRASSV